MMHTTTQEAPVVRRFTVLVVDDDPSIRSVLADALALLGIRAVQSSDAGEALRLLLEDPPDLVLTDLMMPGMDGHEFLTLARSHAPGIPLVLVTGHDLSDAHLEAMGEGISAFLRKPVGLPDLQSLLARLLPSAEGSEVRSSPKTKSPRPGNGCAPAGGEGQDDPGCGGLHPALLRKTTQLSLLAQFGARLHEVSPGGRNGRRAGLGATGGIRPLVERSLDIALRALLGDWAVLALAEGEGVQTVATRGLPVPRVPLDLIVPHVRSGTGMRAWHGTISDVSVIAAPLAVQGSGVGFLCVTRSAGAPGFSWADRELLEAFAAETAVSLENTCLWRQLEGAFQDTVTSLIVTLEARDEYTEGHSLRVAEYAAGIASCQRLPHGLAEQIRTASLLHDLGKVGVRDSVLAKPGGLSVAEWDAMRQHPILGWKILEPLGFLAEEAQVVRHHHEHLDGTGYPDGLKGEAIPLGARIIAVGDAFDAMTTRRPYRPARPWREAASELRRCAGTQFDPSAVTGFEEWLAVAHPGKV
jgi:response regulator RpfG family c-di-GMP phosphodiesterase